MTRLLVVQLRGANGSGKSTLARGLIAEDRVALSLVNYAAPTAGDPSRRKVVVGYGMTSSQTVVVGSYETACGGLDGIDSFDRQRRAIRAALGIGIHVPDPRRVVVCEGVLASTVYGSWAQFDDELSRIGHPAVDFAWVYLRTPLDVCLERIAQRQRERGRERPINERLVADKVRAVARTRERALSNARLVYDLPPGGEAGALAAIVRREGEQYRAA